MKLFTSVRSISPFLMLFVIVTGLQACSGGGSAPADNAPTASNVSITDDNGGTIEVGDSLTGSYIYADTESDAEGVSTFRWLRDGTAISGATSLTYTPVVADSGASIAFEVIPIAATGTTTGLAVVSSTVVVVNNAPTASNVSITDDNGGTIVVGDSLTGSYIYADAENDAEGTSTFRWLRDGAAISGATSLTYTLVVADSDASITFEVIPIAATGSTTGLAVISSDTTITAFELLDPTPGAGDKFGSKVLILGNGNIVITDPYDSSVATNNGAVHLYNSVTRTLIASIYGDVAEDMLGSISITALANNNFVIASSQDDEGGIVDAGSVRLVDGDTGVQIGATLAGDVVEDYLGSHRATALANGNFVIASGFDDEGSIVNAGSIRLVSGTTGLQIGSTLAGDVLSDELRIVIALANSNYVAVSYIDDEGGIVDAGSVRLMDGSTGAQIGATLAGDVASDQLGRNGIFALANNNFVIASQYDDEGGIADAGSVRLVDGTTGAQIGATLTGDATNDFLGDKGITALANNNFVISSMYDDEGGIPQAGSVRLVDGTTGAQIGATLAGDVAFDYLGRNRVTALANNNFVIASQSDDEGGIVNAGSVRLVNGTTGVQIGATLAGDVASDQLGSKNITALANNNFVIASPVDDEGGIVDAGSVRLVDGATGVQIGATLAGDVAGDQLGSRGTTALANNNFVIASSLDDEGGIVDAGSVRLVNGSTGVQIGTTLSGDVDFDSLGLGSITNLANNNFVIFSRFDDEGGIVDAGSVRLVDGSTGAQIGATIAGSAANDMNAATVTGSAAGDFYILSLKETDNNAMVDSGLVRLITQ